MHGARGGAPKGNRNALKHGRYSAEAIERRRAVRDLLRAARTTLDELNEADETTQLIGFSEYEN